MEKPEIITICTEVDIDGNKLETEIKETQTKISKFASIKKVKSQFKKQKEMKRANKFVSSPNVVSIGEQKSNKFERSQITRSKTKKEESLQQSKLILQKLKGYVHSSKSCSSTSLN